MSRTSYILALAILVSVGCQEQKPDQASSDYVREIEDWRAKRVKNLKDDWLPLTGLYWLELGLNTYGSDSTADLVFPPDFPSFHGSFLLDSGGVSFRIDSGSATADKSPTDKHTPLKIDETSPRVFSFESYQWWVIDRAGRYAIRLKNSNSPNLAEFKSISSYPIRHDWHLAASYRPYLPHKTLSIMDVLGMERDQESPGYIRFQIDGEYYQLDVLREGFVIFGDQTNGLSTYGGGRYVYIDLPSDAGPTQIDFNKSYNPPCVFTDFATCPLPPSQNLMPIKVLAGEKYESSH